MVEREDTKGQREGTVGGHTPFDLVVNTLTYICKFHDNSFPSPAVSLVLHVGTFTPFL